MQYIDTENAVKSTPIIRNSIITVNRSIGNKPPFKLKFNTSGEPVFWDYKTEALMAKDLEWLTDFLMVITKVPKHGK